MTSKTDNGEFTTELRSRDEMGRSLDRGFILLAQLMGLAVVGTLLWISVVVALQALPAIEKFGLGFLFSSNWAPNQDQYGAWPQIYGTIVSSILALLIAVPVGIGVALFLSEDYLPPKIQLALVFLVELLAAIPSVVYGLWGIFVLIPILKPFAGWLYQYFRWIPFFSSPLSGPGMLPAAVVLAIMVLPTIAALSRDALINVPSDLRQASYALGSTRWETILKILLPAAFSGIVGAVMLSLGRALGETMAVTMLIGNSNSVNISILAPSNTIASLLANQFAEASGLQISALMYTALILFALTLAINILAELLIRRVQRI